MLSRITIFISVLILMGCASVKLDKPKIISTAENIAKFDRLELQGSKNDVAYVRFRTEFVTNNKDSQSLEERFDCRDFQERWVDGKYEATIVASSIVDDTDSKKNSNDSLKIPIVIYQKNKECNFFPMSPKYISKNNRLISGENKITFSFEFREIDNNSPNLNQVTNDISFFTSALASLIPGSKIINSSAKYLNSDATKETIERIKKYMEESTPEIITHNGGSGTFDVAWLENGVANLYGVKIDLSHSYKKPFFGKSGNSPLGTLHIHPEIKSTLLFKERDNGIPSIEYNSYENTLKKTLGDNTLYKLLQEQLDSENINLLKPENEIQNAHKRFAEACKHLDQLTEKLGFNIYDRAGLLYLLLSDYKSPNFEKNWGDLNKDISKKDIALNDLKKYDNENFYKCIEPYNIALEKMITGLRISKEEIGKLIKEKMADENTASSQIIKETGDKFITLVSNFNIGRPILPENFKSLLSKENSWTIKNEIFPDTKLLQILEILEAQDSTQSNDNKLENFKGNREDFVKLIKGTEMSIINNKNCSEIGIDDLGFPNSIKYLFRSPLLPKAELGVLELYMNATGKNISEIKYSDSSNDFSNIEECSIPTSAT